MTDAGPVQVIPEADFDRDGTYETDLSGYFNARAGGLSVGRGASRQGTPSVGQLSVQLDNPDGTFTPDYASSALYGQLEPHVPIRVRCVHAGIEYVIFTGYVSRFRPRFGRPGENRCLVEAKDLMAHLSGYPSVNVTLAQRTTDEAVEAVALAAGLTAADLDLEAGAQTLEHHWARNGNALEALLAAVRSERGGELFIDAGGLIRMLARDTRTQVSARLSQEWGYGTSVVPERVDPELTDDDLISEAAVQAQILVEDDPDVLIFALESPIPITAGVPITVEFDFPAPVEALDTTPTASEDYLQNSLSDGTGTDQTSDLAVTVTDLGAGFRVELSSTSTGYVTRLNLYALPLNPATARPVFKHSLAIPGQKMAQGVTLDVPYAQDEQTLRDYPVAVCRTYRYPYAFVRLEFAWDTDAVIAAMLGVELWDLVWFDDTGPGGAEFLTNIQDWFYVVGLKHSIVPGEVQRTEVTLVPAHLYFDLDAVAYDDFDRADNADSNVIEDPGFETGIDAGWGSFQGTLTQSNVQAHGDSNSMKVARASGVVYNAFWAESLSGDTAGRSFTGRVWVYGEGDSIGDQLDLIVRENGGAEARADSTVSTTLSAGWQYLEVTRQILEADRTAVELVIERPSGATAGEYFYADDAELFEDYLGTALSSDAWAEDSGFDIVSGAARANSDSAQTPNVLLFESEDQVVEVQLSEIGAGDEVGVVFHYDSAANYSRAYLDKGSNEVIFEHVIGGVATELSSPAYTVGTSAELRVIVQDHRVRVWVDRRLYIDAEDGAGWLGSRVGLFARNASGTTKFTNFHARAI